MPNVFQWDSPNVGNASQPGLQQAQSAEGTTMRCPHRTVLPRRTPLPIWHWCIPRHYIPEPVTKGASATKALSKNVGGIVTDRRCCRHGVTAKANPERLHDKATGLNTYIIADAGTFDGPDGSADTCAHGDRCGLREFCPSAFPASPTCLACKESRVGIDQTTGQANQSQATCCLICEKAMALMSFFST